MVQSRCLLQFCASPCVAPPIAAGKLAGAAGGAAQSGEAQLRASIALAFQPEFCMTFCRCCGRFTAEDPRHLMKECPGATRKGAVCVAVWGGVGSESLTNPRSV